MRMYDDYRKVRAGRYAMLPTPALPTIRLLITDRQPASREALVGLLRTAQDFEIVGTASPDQAIHQAADLRAEAVLLDVVKPHHNSVKVCQELCALSPQPIVIAMTTFADPDEEQDLRHAGAAGYLLKEVHPEKLVHAIRLILAGDCATPAHSTNT